MHSPQPERIGQGWGSLVVLSLALMPVGVELMYPWVGSQQLLSSLWRAQVHLMAGQKGILWVSVVLEGTRYSRRYSLCKRKVLCADKRVLLLLRRYRCTLEGTCTAVPLYQDEQSWSIMPAQ